MRAEPETIAIVVAAGAGRRLGDGGDKAFRLLGGRPLLCYSLEALEASEDVDGVVIVVSKGAVDRCRRVVTRSGLKKVRAIVTGGKRRQDSVRRGLVFAGDSRFVLVHDAARPFLSSELVSRSLAACRRSGAAVAAIPVRDTVKKVSGRAVEKTVPREGLWLAQTPQVFRRDLIERAFREWPWKLTATDDACLLEHGRKPGRKCKAKRVAIVEGDVFNMKITYASDLLLAEALLRLRKKSRGQSRGRASGAAGRKRRARR